MYVFMVSQHSLENSSISQIKLYLGRVAPSAIGWYQQGPVRKLWLLSKNFKYVQELLKTDKRET